MRLKGKTLVATAAVVAVAGIGLVLLWQRPAEVEVLEVRPRTVEQALSVVGRARPVQLVQVASPNAGQVIQLLHDDGDQVATGAPLAIIRATVEQAQTQADAARTEAARASANEARLKYQRTRTLYDQGFAARAALDAARAELDTAEANVAAAAASTRASAARQREFTIRAPMDGVVLVRPIDNGQVVTMGETLFEMGSTSEVEIRAEVEEAYADALSAGQTARGALSGSDAIFPARVTEVSPRVDSSTGGRMIRVVAEDAVAGLTPGRSVDLTVVVAERAGTLTVPRSALIDATAEPKVYVLDADDRVRVRPVTVSRWPSVNAIIEQGLKPGDRVVLEPGSVEPGEKVRPRLQPTDQGR